MVPNLLQWMYSSLSLHCARHSFRFRPATAVRTMVATRRSASTAPQSQDTSSPDLPEIPTASSSSAAAASGDHAIITTAEFLVHRMMDDAAITSTTTKSGWCLRQGLVHVITVDNGRLLDLVRRQGLPSFYHSFNNNCRHHEPTENIKAPETCFQSLCRIIAGQQLAGKAAQSIWKRLLETTQHNLTPNAVLDKSGGADGKNLELGLQKPSGLSRAKAKSILDLAQRFEEQALSEAFLTNPMSTEEDIRNSLLQVKGLGPWSCDMFIMFHLEKPNVFPFGDLGVRKGVKRVFDLRDGRGKRGSLCQKKDFHRACKLVEPYSPYQSLLTYYMWRAADIKEVYDEEVGVPCSVAAKRSNADKTPPGANDYKETPNTPVTAATLTLVASRKRKASTVTP
jgi:DNA-3-methyladenine glycosylase II